MFGVFWGHRVGKFSLLPGKNRGVTDFIFSGRCITMENEIKEKPGLTTMCALFKNLRAKGAMPVLLWVGLYHTTHHMVRFDDQVFRADSRENRGGIVPFLLFVVSVADMAVL